MGVMGLLVYFLSYDKVLLMICRFFKTLDTIALFDDGDVKFEFLITIITNKY